MPTAGYAMAALQHKDIDGAEAAYREAIAADPGHAKAHTNLGLVLQNVRQDSDGAEAAYRAAIAADPGHTLAHYTLGHLLERKEKAEWEQKKGRGR